MSSLSLRRTVTLRRVSCTHKKHTINACMGNIFTFLVRRRARTALDPGPADSVRSVVREELSEEKAVFNSPAW